MEALIAVGLASNVVQFVDFAIRVTSKCRQIYRDGATIEHQELDMLSSKLTTICGEVEKSIREPSVSMASTQTETDLVSLAQRCVKNASHIKDELNQIAKHGDKGFRASVIKAAATMRRSRAINGLRSQLERDQFLLNTSILLSLQKTAREVVDHHRDLDVLLGENTTAIVQNLAYGFCNVRSLVESQGEATVAKVREEGETTRNHITQQLQDFQMSSSTQEQRQELLKSLHFPEINLRQDQVPDAHAETFEFLFNEQHKDMQPWLRFLRSESGLFWLSGKAGSGKTVAMNLTAGDDRTMNLLFSDLSDKAEPLIVTFFAWNAGSTLQNSACGLLRSILYQLLRSDEGIIDQVFARDQKLFNHRLVEVWSEKKLKQLLQVTISSLQRPLFVLVDGVDEFKEEPKTIVDIVKRMTSAANVKICVSGRPWLRLNEKLECEFLKLQDLTEPSIKLYVTDRLEINPGYQTLLKASSTRGEVRTDLVKDILEKACGVFLWVRLAVDQILEGIENLDDWSILVQRLEEIPDEVELVYEKMWKSLDESRNRVYRDEAMQYFAIILKREMSLLEFMVSMDKNLQTVYFKEAQRLPLEKLIQKCDDRRMHLQVRSAGFLEVSRAAGWLNHYEPLSGDLPEKDEADFGVDELLRVQHKRYRVSFLHRTAADFVREKTRNSTLLPQDQETDENAEVVQSTRLRCILWSLDSAPTNFIVSLELGEIARTCRRRNRVPVRCLELLEHVITQALNTEISTLIAEQCHIAYDMAGAVLEYGGLTDPLDFMFEVALPDADYITYLLACYCFRFHYYDDEAWVDMIETLLEKGAQPMQPRNLPSWRPRTLLQNIPPYHLFIQSLWYEVCFFNEIRIDVGTFEKAAAAFLHSGVDVDTRLAFMVGGDFIGPRLEIYLHGPWSQRSYTVLYLLRVGSLLEAIRSAIRGVLEAKTFAWSRASGFMEAVLLRIGRNDWYRVQSEADSQELFKIIDDVRVDYVEQGDVYGSEPRESFEALSHRSERITRDVAYEDWKIDGWDLQTLTSLAEDIDTSHVRTQRGLINELKLPRQLLLAVVSQEEAERLTEEGFWDDEGYDSDTGLTRRHSSQNEEGDIDMDNEEDYESDNEHDEKTEKKDDRELDDEVEEVLRDQSQGNGRPQIESSSHAGR